MQVSYFCHSLSFAGTQPLSVRRHHNSLISDCHFIFPYNISSMNCIHLIDKGLLLKIHNCNMTKSFISVIHFIRQMVLRSGSTYFQRLSSAILFPFFFSHRLPHCSNTSSSLPLDYHWGYVLGQNWLYWALLLRYLDQNSDQNTCSPFHQVVWSYKEDNVIRKDRS